MAERTSLRQQSRRADRDRHALSRPRDIRRRQRLEFGGVNGATAFFGWLVATGFAALLTAVLAAAGIAINLTDNARLTNSASGVLQVVTHPPSAEAAAQTIGALGGALFVGVVLLAYFFGGYVSGRMARFDGFRQGFAVWIVELIFIAGLAAVGIAFGAQYNVFNRLNLPRVPIGEGALTETSLIVLGAAALAMLVAALFGGKLGERFHRKVDKVGASNAPK